MADIVAHTHGNTITLYLVSILFKMETVSTHLGNTIYVETGEGSVSESCRRRGQGRKKHRLSLHGD